jgi:phenol 2-monooxygenase
MGVYSHVVVAAALSQPTDHQSKQVPGDDGIISCAARQNLTKQHLTDLPSPFVSLTISQGRIERFLVDNIAENSGSTLSIERGVAAESLVYDTSLENDHEAYPIKVTLRGLPDAEANPAPGNGGYGGRDILAKNSLPQDELEEFESAANREVGVETVEARYLISADGAHSWVRHALDYKTQGSGLDSLWCVDSRSKCPSSSG